MSHILNFIFEYVIAVFIFVGKHHLIFLAVWIFSSVLYKGLLKDWFRIKELDTMFVKITKKSIAIILKLFVYVPLYVFAVFGILAIIFMSMFRLPDGN